MTRSETSYCYRYEYVAIMDYDDIFVSKTKPNWEKMMQELIDIFGAHDSFRFRNTYFMDKMQEAHGYEQDVPEYLTIMKNVYRSVISTDQTKSIHKTEEVLGKFFFHFANIDYKHVNKKR